VGSVSRWARPLVGLALLLICSSVLVAAAPPARAQDKSVVVERRDGDITIERNGDVRVVETWRVRFIGGPFTHAFRSIPLNHVDSIDGWSVAENGRAYSAGSGDRNYVVDNSGTDSTITWYFPATSDATRTFTLGYTLHGALRIYGGGDQFYWTFIESDRAYTIDAARVTVHLPSTFSTGNLKATTYQNGSENAAGAHVVDGRTVSFEGGPFPPGTEWEIRAQFPHGVVTASVPAWQATLDRQPVFNLIALVAAMLVLLGGLLSVYLLWYTRGRDPAAGIVAEFYNAPPDDSPPGVAGTLIEERADMKDIIATLVDLARRGYLHIEEQSQSDFLFVQQAPAAGSAPLRPYEQTLLATIFERSGHRELSDLREKFYRALPGLKNALLDETVQAGYFPRSPATTRQAYLMLGIGVLVVAVLGVWASLSSFVMTLAPLAVLVPIAAILVAIGLIAVSPAMPKRTARGATAVAKWRAFRRYLRDVNRYTQVDAAKEQFERYLPYAIAFGLERAWVKAFEAVNTPAPIWYYPYGYGPYFRGSSGGGSGRSDSGPGGGGAPSLDSMARGSFAGLTAMSSGFFSMLDSTASVFNSRPASSGSGGGGWSGGGSGGGGGGGGGSSGFG